MLITSFYVVTSVICFGNPQKLFRYEVTTGRVAVENLNRSLANISLKLSFINRTTKAVNGHFQFFLQPSDDFRVSMKEYRFLNNEFKLTAVQFDFKLRQYLQLDWAGLQSLFKEYMVPPYVWPLKKGVVYRLTNWMPDANKIQFPYAPVGDWKSVVTYYLQKEMLKIADVVLYQKVANIVDIY